MKFKIAYDISYEKVADADQAEAVLERLETMYGPRGHRCVAHIANGSSDDPWQDAMMRVGIDIDLDRGFVSWRGESVEYGYEPRVDALARALIFDDDPYEPPLELAPSRTRVTAGLAKRAVREYLTTGQRPTCVRWRPEMLGSGSDDGPPNSELALVLTAITDMIHALDPLVGTPNASNQRFGISALYLTGIRQLLTDLHTGLVGQALAKEDAARLLRLLRHNVSETTRLLGEEREHQARTRSRKNLNQVDAVIAAVSDDLTGLASKVMRLFTEADDHVSMIRV